MSEDQLKKEDQLFIHLVNTFVQSAWISLGKVKNPVSDELERNVEQASYYIDLLDMLQAKMKGNLSEWEEQYILHSLSELKLNYIDEKKKKTEEVFYNPKTARKKLIDEVFKSVNEREKAIRIIMLAKSAIRHNMGKDLPNFKMPTCLIWGKQDNVTPPHVAKKFHSLLQNSELNWIDKCGHAPMMENPKAFNKILEKWLSNQYNENK